MVATAVQSRIQGQEENQSQHQGEKRTNVGSSERFVSVAAGAILAVQGLSRRSIPGAILALVGASFIQRGWTGQCGLYEKLGLDTAHTDGAAEPEDYFRRGIHVEEVLTIGKSAEELYAYWKDFKNLPTIMNHLEAVNNVDERRTHWIAKGPAGKQVEWDAEVINDEPNSVIAWRSLENADVHNAGSVRFVPALGDRGTQVRVVLDFIPPAGKVGAFIAKLFGENPQQQIHEDLRRFKMKMETGEIATTEGQPRGTCMKSGGTRDRSTAAG